MPAMRWPTSVIPSPVHRRGLDSPRRSSTAFVARLIWRSRSWFVRGAKDSHRWLFISHWTAKRFSASRDVYVVPPTLTVSSFIPFTPRSFQRYTALMCRRLPLGRRGSSFGTSRSGISSSCSMSIIVGRLHMAGAARGLLSAPDAPQVVAAVRACLAGIELAGLVTLRAEHGPRPHLHGPGRSRVGHRLLVRPIFSPRHRAWWVCHRVAPFTTYSDGLPGNPGDQPLTIPRCPDGPICSSSITLR